jgi:hypothetical protein
MGVTREADKPVAPMRRREGAQNSLIEIVYDHENLKGYLPNKKEVSQLNFVHFWWLTSPADA